MSDTLVGDRFVRESATTWRDLATGDEVFVRVHPRPDEWAVRERQLADEYGTDAQTTLVDFGLVGRGAWFEARASVRRARSAKGTEAADEWAERLAVIAAGPHGGVRFAAVPLAAGGDVRRAAGAAARRLRALGFVTVRAAVTVPARVAGALPHRHVAVLLCDAADRRWAACWVRRLARVSPRAHLIADLAGGPASLAAGMLHERAGEAVEGPVYRARWATPLATPSAAPARQATDGSVARARDAKARLLAGELAAAESMLAEAVALRASGGADPHPAVALVQAELRFWQGRFEEAAALCRGGVAASIANDQDRADGWLVSGLVAWATGDVAAVLVAAAACADDPAPAPERTPWAAALAALAGALQADPAAVGRAIATGRIDAAVPARVPALAQAMLAEALGAVGEEARARRFLRVTGNDGRVPSLHRLLLDWLRQEEAGLSTATLTARVNRAGAHGVRRWGSRTMHLLHALPAMLQLVHDAEDDLAALNGSCAWLRRHAQASAVAFLAPDGQIVAGDGWPAAGFEPGGLADALAVTSPRVVAHRDDEGLGVAPVRYGGRPIGLAVVIGPSRIGATLTQAAATLAALGAPALRTRLDALALARDSQTAAPEILGRSPAIRALRDALVRAAAAPFPVLVEGESGTGKELVARALHRLSVRRDRRFSAVNCAALGDDLIEAELFGHARGAFTGAVSPRAGLFEDAHGGTLMLDEVSELSARAQAKLLRVLQEREVRRLGENAARPVDVRLVAATNRPLGELASRGLFREDLLFRLAVIRLRLPPLSDRLEDVAVLAQAFWRDLARQAGTRAVLGADALAALCQRRWPGNVRELQNVIAALVVEAPARGRLGARAVAHALSGADGERPAAAVSLIAARLTCERQTVASALARHAGRRAAAARELGLTRQGLAKAIKRLGLLPSADRPGERAGVA